MFLVGTAMGGPKQPAPSVVVHKGILQDISESETRSPNEFRINQIEMQQKHVSLVNHLMAPDLDSVVLKRLDQMTRSPTSRLDPKQVSALRDVDHRLVVAEPMASGNIYFNKELKKNDSSVTKRFGIEYRQARLTTWSQRASLWPPV